MIIELFRTHFLSFILTLDFANGFINYFTLGAFHNSMGGYEGAKVSHKPKLLLYIESVANIMLGLWRVMLRKISIGLIHIDPKVGELSKQIKGIKNDIIRFNISTEYN